jgi:hypothetical protein
MFPQKNSKISARKTKNRSHRICQGDIFKNIEIIEDVVTSGAKVFVSRISFPYVICLNQECDLENDFNESIRDVGGGASKDNKLLHLAIAPAFNFEHYLAGGHWGKIFLASNTSKRDDTKIKLLTDNEIPRYHYLRFPDKDMPELIVDFKHFFTISRDVLYKNMDKRLCSLDDLFKEKLSQRFSNFISRIGLPEEIEDVIENQKTPSKPDGFAAP